MRHSLALAMFFVLSGFVITGSAWPQSMPPPSWARPKATGATSGRGAAGQARGQEDGLDLNMATPAQLRALPGMGDAYVRRIVAGRPYTAKNQLVTRGILPQGAYDRIASRIVAHRLPR